MKQFSIYTICTENYKDALDFSLPSWLQFDSVDGVIIYTDFDYEHPDPKVMIRREISKTNDWLHIVGLKAPLLKILLTTEDISMGAFIDVDCYMRKDISAVFDFYFDIAPTRMNVKGKSANSGVWFFRNTTRTLKFAVEWQALQSKYVDDRKGMVKHAPSYSQLSFSDILHRELKQKRYLHVHPVSEDTYNSEADIEEDWIKKVQRTDPRILHFKGRRWRNEKLVSKLIK